MNPYSHLVLAHRLEAEIRPADPAAYYWGTVAPDLRYTARLPRPQTHLEPGQILAFRAMHPELESFIQGYLIHCLADEVELWKLLERRWYLRPFIRCVSLKLPPFLLESYLLDKIRITPPISAQQNPILQALGVKEEAIQPFYTLVKRLVDQPSFDSLIHLFRVLGEGRPNLQRGTNVASKLRPYRAVFFALSNPPHLMDAVEEFVQDSPAFRELTRQTRLSTPATPGRLF